MSRSWRASGYLLAAGGAAILLVYVVTSLAVRGWNCEGLDVLSSRAMLPRAVHSDMPARHGSHPLVEAQGQTGRHSRRLFIKRRRR